MPGAWHQGPEAFPSLSPSGKMERPGRGRGSVKLLGVISAALFLYLQLTREFFTKELTKHYQGNNDTDVFSATWNSVMITVSDIAPKPVL